MAEGIRVGSYKTVSKTLDHLEALEVLERVPGPRGRGKAARYLLLDPSPGGACTECKHRGARETRERKSEGKRYRRGFSRNLALQAGIVAFFTLYAHWREK